MSNKCFQMKDTLYNDTYFVGSDGAEVTRLYFSLEEAKYSQDEYIDVFDNFGNKTETYMWTTSGYTTDF